VKLAVEMLGRNRWSNSWVKFVGQIAGRIHGSNSLVELLDQIGRSNSWIKFLGQIPGSNLLVKSAGQMQPIHGPPLASLGQCMDTPTDGPKMGKDGRERGKKSPTHRSVGLGWLAL